MHRAEKDHTPRDRHTRTLRPVGAIAATCVGFLVLGANAAGACTTTKSGGSHDVLTAADFASRPLVGTIGTIGASSFTLTGESGVTWTVDVTSATTVVEGHQDIAYAALTSGEKVRVQGSVTSSSADTFSADRIAVVLVNLEGTVVSSGTGSFVIADGDGFWRTIVESASTTYAIGPDAIAAQASAASIVAGVRVDAVGIVDANHTSLDATAIRIELARVDGTVSSVSGTSFVIADGGQTVTVTTSSSTVFVSSSGVSTIAAVTPGSRVLAAGEPSSAGTFAASYVAVLPIRHLEPQASTANFVVHPNQLRHRHHH